MYIALYFHSMKLVSFCPMPPVDEFHFMLSQVSNDELTTLSNPSPNNDAHEQPQKSAAPKSKYWGTESKKNAVPKKSTTWGMEVWQDRRMNRFQMSGPPHSLSAAT